MELIQTITFDADGRTLAVSTNTITLFSPQTGEVLGVHKVINDNMSESNERIDSMALSPDGRTVAYSYVAYAWYTRTVRAWSVGAATEIHTMEGDMFNIVSTPKITSTSAEYDKFSGYRQSL